MRSNRPSVIKMIERLSILGLIFSIYALSIGALVVYRQNRVERSFSEIRVAFERMSEILAGRVHAETLVPIMEKYGYDPSNLEKILSQRTDNSRTEPLVRAEIRNFAEYLRNFEFRLVQKWKRATIKAYFLLFAGVVAIGFFTIQLLVNAKRLLPKMTTKVKILAENLYVSPIELDEPTFSEEDEIQKIVEEVNYIEVIHNLLKHTPLSTTLEDFISSAGLYLCLLFDAQKFSMLLIDWDTEVVTVEGVYAARPELNTKMCVGLRIGLRGTLFEQLLGSPNKVLVVDDIEKAYLDTGLPCFKLLLDESFKSMMVAVSTINGRPLGFFVLSSLEPGAFSLKDSGTFAALARMLSYRFHYSLAAQRILSYLGSGLVNLAEFRDTETGNHLKRVSLYSKIIAQELNLPPKMIREIAEFAPLHDIGKVGIPDAILLKPGKLNAEEWEVMKTHVTFGARAVERFIRDVSNFLDPSSLNTIYNIVVDHHERWDGTGYPAGKKGEEISIEGRVIAVADVFDALTSVRPYKGPMPFDEAVNVIREERGRQFDPKVVDAFLARIEEIRRVYETLKD